MSLEDSIDNKPELMIRDCVGAPEEFFVAVDSEFLRLTSNKPEFFLSLRKIRSFHANLIRVTRNGESARKVCLLLGAERINLQDPWSRTLCLMTLQAIRSSNHAGAITEEVVTRFGIVNGDIRKALENETIQLYDVLKLYPCGPEAFYWVARILISIDGERGNEQACAVWRAKRDDNLPHNAPPGILEYFYSLREALAKQPASNVEIPDNDPIFKHLIARITAVSEESPGEKSDSSPIGYFTGLLCGRRRLDSLGFARLGVIAMAAVLCVYFTKLTVDANTAISKSKKNSEQIIQFLGLDSSPISLNSNSTP